MLLAGSTGATASSSAKPTYCAAVNNFKSAVAQLKASGKPTVIISSVTRVVSSGESAISAVKTAFAPQARALKSSLVALDKSAKQLESSSTRASALKLIPGEVSAVKATGAKFVTAAKTKCG